MASWLERVKVRAEEVMRVVEVVKIASAWMRNIYWANAAQLQPAGQEKLVCTVADRGLLLLRRISHSTPTAVNRDLAMVILSTMKSSVGEFG